MLQTKAVEPITLGLIKDLFNHDYIKPYLLVGGTALALQIGHRTSTDIDLFINTPHDTEYLLNALQQDYEVFVRNRFRHALFVDINGIKADIIFQKCHLIDSSVIIEGIKMASLKEIAAMKLLAVTNRGRKRDFIDLFFLLKEFPLIEMLLFFKEKFENDNYFLILRSLTYFEDAEEDEELKYFFTESWDEIKAQISEAVKTINLQ